MLSTTGSIVCFCLMFIDLNNHNGSTSHHFLWFGLSVFWFSVIFAVQGLMLHLLLKAYVVIKNASKTLGMQTQD